MNQTKNTKTNPHPTHQQKRTTRHTNKTLKITKHAKTYDKTTNKFTFNITYETYTKPTPRSLIVAEAFGLGIDETQKFPVLNTQLTVTPNDIVLITGDSGSGKSVLLRALRKDLGDEAVDLSEVTIDTEKPLIETVGATVEQGLELLSKVGLNDAFLFLRTYSQLSDGQKYRYRIAKLIESKKQWWLMDEFAACLDRDTAKIIAYNLQKIARQTGKSVIVATTHNDLKKDLNPSVHIHKRFGEEIKTTYHPNTPATTCSLAKEMHIQPGTTKQWETLSKFHYRNHKTSVPRKIFQLTRNQELCGVIVYSYPPPACFARRQMLPKLSIQQLNQQLSVINRIVIHPKYRTIGLGAKLIRETLLQAGTPYVELIAVMAKYSPFAEKAGMQKITQQQTVKTVQKTTQTLQELGFNLQLLCSQQYVNTKLENLNEEQINKLKEAFIKEKHARFKREFTTDRHLPFGTTTNYTANIQNADNQKIAKLIKLVGILSQTKAYLFWSNPQTKPIDNKDSNS